MKIAFFTEGGFVGKIDRNHPNMRTDVSWQCALKSTHHPIVSLPTLLSNMYDIGICIVPKNKSIITFSLSDELRRVCSKIILMQESFYAYWQNDSVVQQVWYYEFIQEVDLILCHNNHDLKYYGGITDVRCELMPSLMITDNVKPYSGDKTGVMVGGNWVEAYRGIDSYIIGKILSDDIYSPTTGRMKADEKQLDIHHYEWLIWLDWMHELSKRKYGVQLGTPAAGTFSLNCSFLGIPCIGYNNVNTQKYLHPQLSVDEADMVSARKLANRLATDDAFYEECSKQTLALYDDLYCEDVFLNKMLKLFNEL